MHGGCKAGLRLQRHQPRGTCATCARPPTRLLRTQRAGDPLLARGISILAQLRAVRCGPRVVHVHATEPAPRRDPRQRARPARACWHHGWCVGEREQVGKQRLWARPPRQSPPVTLSDFSKPTLFPML